MFRSVQVVLLAATSLAVLAVPVVAIASPTPSPAPAPTVAPKSQSNTITLKVRLNSGQTDFVKTASKLLINGTSGSTLDWRKAKSYWGVHTTTRDNFTAGWVQGGGKLKNASQSTITRLKNRNPNGNPNARVAAKKPNCTGETKLVKVDSSTIDNYYDSCAVLDMADAFDECAHWVGTAVVFAKKWKPLAGIIVLTIAACNSPSSELKKTAAKSDLNAIIWRTHTYKAYTGGYGTTSELLPQ